MNRYPFTLVLICLLFLTACGDDDDGEGSIAVSAYGESFIEEGIPAAEMDDGWAVQFDQFVVTLERIRVANAALPDPAPVDLTQDSNGQGHELGTLATPAGDYTDASFTIANVAIVGSATLAADTKTFDWQLDQPTDYSQCETTTTVADSQTATFEITVHADHLFYDSLVSHSPGLHFQSLADADADADGVISQAELAATDIGTYDPGSEGGIDNLWSWLLAQARTLGHVDGEGHCHAAASGS